MGFISKLFGSEARKSRGSSQFPESEAQSAPGQAKSRNAPHRELVRVVLRDTMRKHGIPSDWIDVRALSVLTRQHKAGMHVQFLVHKGDHQLLHWVHAFQESFREQIESTDPSAKEWLFSVGWEFYGKSQQGFDAMPAGASWQGDEGPDTVFDEEGPGNAVQAREPGEADERDSVASDLQALHALMSQPADLTALPGAPADKQKPR